MAGEDCKGLGYRLRQIEATIADIEVGTAETCGALHKFDVATSGTGLYVSAFSISIDPATVVRIVWELDCRQNNGANRASFRREALFYRESGSVSIQDPPHTPLTVRSSKLLDVEYQLSSSSITFRVKDAGSASRWKGCCHVYVVQ